jgi:excisionase family DNA binding protein
MKLTVEDLDTAADFIVRFLNGHIEEGFLGVVRTTATRLVDSIITPSGKLLGVVETTPNGTERPHVVRLCFSELPPEPYKFLGGHPPAKATRVMESAGEALSDIPPHVRRHQERMERRRQEAARTLHFHLLLPGQHTAALGKEQEALPRCVVCHRKFTSRDTSQRYCCRNHHEGQRLHSEECTSVVRGSRALRQRLGDERAIRLEPHHHLVACGEDQAGLFLQMALYAERARKLDAAAMDTACNRFVKQFRSTVRRLPNWCQQEKESAESLLLKAWEKIKATYRVPSTPDDFSRYARRLISIVKRDPRSQNEILAESAGIELDNERIGTDVLRKRKGEKRWTNRGLKDQKEDYSLREAAALVGIEERTFYKLVERGRIPAQREGRYYRLLSNWETEARHWKEQEQPRLRQSGLRKLFALAWEKRQGLRRSSTAPEKISPSAITQIKRWWAAGMTEDEIKQKIGEKSLKQAIREAGRYLTEQELEALYMRNTPRIG